MDFVKIWRRAAGLAGQTPESRNRYVDFLRALSIGAVVLGHWLVAAPYLGASGAVESGHLLASAPWTRWLTWGFQVMPIFFLVGGYANGTSWEAAHRRGAGYGGWLRSRLERLVAPVLPLLLAWTGLSALAHGLGAPAELLHAASRVALVPAWFLAAYVLIVAFVPLSHAAWRRLGVGSIAALGVAAVAVDLASFAAGFEAVGYLNYLFVWLAIHQLGYAWRAGVLAGPGRCLTLAATALVALVGLVAFGPYPVAMIGVPGEAVSNSMPPTLALLALGIAQSGAVLALEGPARRLLARPTPWTATVLVNGMIMSLYLWHMTALIAVVGLASALAPAHRGGRCVQNQSRRYSRPSGQRAVCAGPWPLQGLPDRRGPHALEELLQRVIENAGGTAAACEVPAGNDRSAEVAGDCVVTLPAVQPQKTDASAHSRTTRVDLQRGIG